MTVLLVVAIWIGASAVFAPVIGHLLFSLNVAYPTVLPARLSPPARPARAFARRRVLHNSWTRPQVVQSKFG
jgi:hypothetical protein